MTRLVILGAGGHGAVVADAAKLTGHWSDIVFLDDSRDSGSSVLGYSVVDALKKWADFNRPDVQYIVAIGNNSARLNFLAAIEIAEGSIATVIHPSATISQFADIGDGVVVCAGSVVNPRATMDKGVIINTGATVDHDCVLGRATHVSPGAHLAGGVHVGNRSWLGIGSSVREGVRIGDDVVVGAGAVVVADVPSNSTVVGVPARPVES